MERKRRADAQRNVDALLEAAAAVFAEAGVDAPPKQIADRAGVGVGTLYRHFPLRSDLIKAVFRREADACLAAAAPLAAEHPPGEALSLWLQRFALFVGAKRGLAAALHSGDPAYEELRAYHTEHFGPTLQGLLDTAAASGDVRAAMTAPELLSVVSNLCVAAERTAPGDSQRLVAIFANGLATPAD